MRHYARLLSSLIVLGLIGSATGALATGDAAKGLKYQFKSGETYVYAVTIVAEGPDATETSKGTIQLVVKAADATSMQLAPTVSLPKQVKAKAGFKGGPGFKGPKGPFGPPTFTARLVTIDPYGKIVKSSGETSLPYLLGAATELMIEPLSPKGENKWGTEKDLVIREVQRSVGFGPPRASETNTSAKEVVTYEIAGTEGATAQIKKTYDLKTAAPEGTDARIQLQGTADLAFDTQAGLMKSGEFKGAIVLSEKNVTRRIPLTYSYRLMTEAEVATLKKEQDERKAKSIEAAKEAAALKPVADADITSALADLKSTKKITAIKAADRLAHAIPIEARRQEVAKELAGYLGDLSLRMHASKALKVWGTDQAVTPLLKHQEWTVRMEACKVLAEIGTKEALPALRAAQSDSNRLVINEAAKAIKAVEAR